MKSARTRLAICLALVLGLLAAPSAFAASSGVVISQVYGGGGNTGAPYNADYVELFNRGTTPVSVGGWSIQYASAAGTGHFGANSGQLAELPDVTIQPGRYLLVQMSGAGTIGAALPEPRFTDPTAVNMSGSAGKVALATGTTTLGCNGSAGQPCDAAALARIVDLVGYGTANFFEGAGPAPALSNTTAALRAGSGCIETDNNSADFTAAAPQPRTSDTDPHFCDAENAPSVASTTPANAATGVAANANVSITFSEAVATATGWYTIACASSGTHIATQTGGSSTFTLDPTTDFAPGEACTVTVAKDLVADTDALDPPDTMAADHVFSFTVFAPPPIRTIGEVQGAVDDLAVGNRHASPFRGQTVVIRGVIYEKTLTRDARTGDLLRGFFIQNTDATDDGNPLTSDGIFVFTRTFPDLIGGYVPTVGDEVVISGRVEEDFNLTRLVNASLVERVGAFADLDVEVPAVETDPPTLLADADRYWERLEGMRVRVPAGSVITDGLDVFAGSLDSEMWVMRGDEPVAQRSNPYAARVFRDPHPLDNNPTPLFDDGNGYRIMVAALGRKGATNDWTTVLSPARTFDRTTNDLVGGVYYAFSKYSVQTVNAPELARGVDPSLNAPPTAGNRHVQYSVGDYNVENLYDFRDDPHDGCDFVGNAGCTGVNPPFDYVPASAEAYETRLGLQAQQIVGDLHSPDIILVQEAEDQDICTVTAGALTCGETNNADGKPDTLQELALAIRAAGGPAYDAAFDRDGSDDRGIVAALMYRTDRVELLPPMASHPVLGSSPQVEYVTAGNAYNNDVQNPKSLNAPLPPAILAEPANRRDGVEVYTRDPQVGFFRIWRTAVGVGAWTDVYAISNHFSSTPDNRINQRREQARYLANIVDALGDGAQVVAGGDFNVYPRPDDPVLPPSDQLGPLYEQGLTNLWDVLVEEAPAAAYSYVFLGMAQTLDGQFVTENLLAKLRQTRVAHVNADFPADYDGDGARGLSDHDPLASRFAMPATFAGVEALLAYYRDSGAITGNNTYEQLLGHLQKAKTVGDDQLRAFIAQVRDKTPRFVTPTASGALIREAELLAAQQ